MPRQEQSNPKLRFILSVEGTAVSNTFNHRNASALFPQCMEVAKRLGVRVESMTTIGYEDISFVLPKVTNETQAINAGRKLANEYRKSTSPQSLREFGVVSITKDDPNDVGYAIEVKDIR